MKFLKKRKKTKEEIIAIIESFIAGKGNEWDWDDFISIPIYNQELEKIRFRCLELPKEFPPDSAGKYCNKKGVEALKKIILELKIQN